ncbi:esterase-like activity of phytase family protein [Croceibacterium sp. LX-88]|uniref:Esterase-like activity of phytase family protein n=1 Tax=Croceibacterium selenioxidans TaxID=2838833 RepID=A0ABS5W6I2_9SPHN|nr:esterase-like activity of phytase family protein [Croceibacterium selenioxidans]MBT2135326.1 esterase-like activity of phytase family protein [Croceibacterium selenioxidans]
MLRLFLLLVVALVLAPGTWIRSTPGASVEDNRQALSIKPLPVTVRKLGVFDVAGVWELDSRNSRFGSYSGLVALDSGRLLAVSDSGNQLEFTPPGDGPPRPFLASLIGQSVSDKTHFDAESATRDRTSGRLWVGYEQSNSIARLDRNRRPEGRARPLAMRNWGGNTGPEALARLTDGRFVVLAEADPGWFADDFPGLLFPYDPVEGSLPQAFRFAAPESFRPVDMVQLPDGRVLILLREVKWRLPPRFAGKLMVADPAQIRRGSVWKGEVVADLDEPLATDNYEGLAVTQARDGAVVAWLISDDNSASFQRTLLLKLEWRPEAEAQQKAHGTDRTPR